VGVAIFYLLVFQFVVKGEPYDFAKQWIRESKTVGATLGRVNDTTLSLKSYLSFSGPAGEARYKINVLAEKGAGTVYLYMKKNAGVWEVTKANLILSDGTIVPL
jgi:hypothetical protein